MAGLHKENLPLRQKCAPSGAQNPWDGMPKNTSFSEAPK